MPERIQLRRHKGWRMPENTVKVDRSTRWGNPFIVGEHGSRSRCVQLYRDLLGGNVHERADIEEQRRANWYALAESHELRGKNLACWCPLDAPCHADVLLEIANQEAPES